MNPGGLNQRFPPDHDNCSEGKENLKTSPKSKKKNRTWMYSSSDMIRAPVSYIVHTKGSHAWKDNVYFLGHIYVDTPTAAARQQRQDDGKPPRSAT